MSSPAIDDFATDFRPVDEGQRAMSLLVRGKNRREVADELGITLTRVHIIVANEIRRRSGAAGTRREAIAVLHASLDDITDRVFRALDSEAARYDLAPLLEVNLGVQRLRAQLLAAEHPAPEAHTTDTERKAPRS